MKNILLASILLASFVPACAFRGIVRTPVSTVPMRPVVLHGSPVTVAASAPGASVGMGVNAGPNGASMSIATPQGAVGMGVNAGPNGASINMVTPRGGVSVGADASSASAGVAVSGTDANGNAVSATVNVSH